MNTKWIGGLVLAGLAGGAAHSAAAPVRVAHPAAPEAGPCGSAEHRKLDFWVGEWDVVNRAGQPAGSSSVRKILGGCVIFENWTGTRGGYQGQSFNTYDPATRKWTQHWADTTGSVADMTGAFEGQNLVYLRDFPEKGGVRKKTRMTFFNLGPDRVRQLVEESTDDGKSWSVQYDLRYVRRKQVAASPGPGAN